MEIENYEIGNVHTIDSGEQEIIVYNGSTLGTITFTISFSGAYNALAAAASAIALVSLF